MPTQVPRKDESTAPAPSITVLMVEPHADAGDMYADYFRHYGVGVMTVSNVTDALAALSNANVVITNIRLPADGIELIARGAKNTPIVVLSTSLFSRDRQRAEEAGCDVFLPKPCLPGALLQRVWRLLLRSKLMSIRGKSAKSDVRRRKTVRRKR